MTLRTRALTFSGRAVMAVTLAAAALVAIPRAAVAADLSGFEAGDIMSNSIFYDSTTMSANDIQTFLNAKGASCTSSVGTCLKDFVATTPNMAADSYCRAYTGGNNQRAADIIAGVATACGINPQVIIVTLQKEQGLVTATSPKSATAFTYAMGYGCPDSTGCASFPGFFNQVYYGARQFQLYTAGVSGSFRVGVAQTIRYSPTTVCGGSTVVIQNQATANLYDYTPYQPNAASLAAGYGSAANVDYTYQSDPNLNGACAAYGNRNFWNYFTDWFGSTTQRPPFGHVEGVTVTGQSITVSGWALDPDTTSPINVHVYVDSVGQAFTANVPRADVGAAFHKGDNHGFNATVTAPFGTHQLCVYAIDSSGAGPNPAIDCRTVTLTNHAPFGNVEAMNVTGSTLTVSGWAIDPDTTGPIAVHVYIDSVGQAFTANVPRADVGAAFGMGDNHGFAAQIPFPAGTHQVCVYAIDAAGAGPNPTLSCGTFTVANHPPFGNLEAMSLAGSTLNVSGWAIDPDTTAPIAVKVAIDGTGQTITANVPRADVGAAYGDGDNHGFAAQLPFPVGTHQACVYAVDASGGPSANLGCRTLGVANAAPFGNVEAVTLSGSTLTVSGWAIDPDTTGPISVHVYVDNVGQAFTANIPRADVGAVFGKGDDHGFAAQVPFPAGTHQVCVYAIDSGGAGPNPALSCRTVSLVNHAPFGNVEAMSVTGSTLTVSGWAIDPDTTDPIGVQVSIDSVTQAVTANIPRADVGAAYGMGDNHGFAAQIPFPAGTHQVCVNAVDSSGAGPNPALTCRQLG